MFEDDEIVSADPAYWIPSNYRDEPVHMAITADGSPVVPPADWFSDPGLTRPTALVIEQDGRVYGHIACWETKHIGMPGAIRPPRSKSNYAFFATGAIQTQQGQMVDVGQITLVGGHAPIDVDVPKAVAHYDDTQSAVCDVSIGEDRYGIWVAGSLRPDVDDKQVRQLRASAVSGDWRPINGNLELVAVCSVNVPGFPIPRARVASGQTLALVAAGIELLVEDRLREYGDGSQHEIDEVLMAIATRVERLEAWMLAVVDPENMSSLEDEDEYGHGEHEDSKYDSAHEHGEGCGCGMMSGGYGEYGKKKKKKRMAMVSSKDIKMNADSIEKSTSIEDLRKRVYSPLMASLRSRVRGGNESAPFDRASELRNRVHASTGVTAAVGKFDGSLHPRGKDGKFIEKLGFVNFSVGRKQQRGQVVGIGKGTGNNKGKTVLTIKKEDGSTVDMTSDKVSQASKSKADLSPNTGAPNQVVANKPDDIYAEVQRLTDTPIEDWEREDRVSAAFAGDVLTAREKELNYSINAPENAEYRDSLKEEFDGIRDLQIVLFSKEMEYDKANGSNPQLTPLVDEDLAKTNAYKNIAKVRELSSAAKPYLDKPVEDWTPQEREDAWDTANAIGDVVFNPGSEEDVLPSGISESAIEISQTLLNKSVKYDQDEGKTPWYQGGKSTETPAVKAARDRAKADSWGDKLAVFHETEGKHSVWTINEDGTKNGGRGDFDTMEEAEAFVEQSNKLTDLRTGVDPYYDETPIEEQRAKFEELKAKWGDEPHMWDTAADFAPEDREDAVKYRFWTFSKAFEDADNSAPDVDTPAGDGMRNTPSEARAFAAEQDRKQFSKQDEINAIFSKEKTDSYGRDLSPEDQDRLIELLEEKQAETGLAGFSDKEDLRRLKKWQSERGNAGQGDKEADLEINLDDPTLPPSTVSTIKALQKSADNMVSMAEDFRRMGNPTLADETLASRDTTLKTAKWLSIVNSEEGSYRLARIGELESKFGNAYATDVVKNMTTSEERKELLDLIVEQNKIDATYNPLEAREARLAAIKEIVNQLDGGEGQVSTDTTDGDTGLKTIGDVEMFDLDEETYRDEDFLAAGSQLYSLPEDEWTPELYDWASQILDLIGLALDDTSEEDDEYEVYETVYGDLSRKLDVVNDKLGGITSSASPSAYMGYLRQRVHQN